MELDFIFTIFGRLLLKPARKVRDLNPSNSFGSPKEFQKCESQLKVLLLFIYSWNYPKLYAMRRLFCIRTSETEPGWAKPESSCTLTYTVSCLSMQQCHVHYLVHRKQHFNAESIKRCQGKTFVPWSLHITVFRNGTCF